MIFEQPKELNPLVAPAEKISLPALWLFAQAILPLGVMIMAFTAETRFLQGLPIRDAWVPGVLVFPMPLLAMWLALWATRSSWRFPRVLEITDRGVRMPRPSCDVVLWETKRSRRDSPGDARMNWFSRMWIPWKRVASFTLAPVGAPREYKQVTVRLTRGSPTLWSMALTDDRHYEDLLAELKRHQALGHGRFTIEIFHQPIVRPKGFVPLDVGFMARQWMATLGLLLLLNAVPMLLVAFAPRKVGHPEPAGRVHPWPVLVAWRKQYATDADVRHALMKIGGVLAATGAACCGLSIYPTTKKKEEQVFTADERILPPSPAA
jgi:hypothetical protein